MSDVDPNADVSPDAKIGAGTRVWAHAQIREDAVIGSECVVGRGAYIDHAVRLGDRVKVQNLAQIFSGADVADGVFIGPSAILTNDQYPRAITPTGELATASDWTAVCVTVKEGASIGAGAVCVAPVVIGRWAMVAAGATVVQDVPDFALVAGTPSRVVGWVGRSGRRLVPGQGGLWRCPLSGDHFKRVGDLMVEVAP